MVQEFEDSLNSDKKGNRCKSCFASVVFQVFLSLLSDVFLKLQIDIWRFQPFDKFCLQLRPNFRAESDTSRDKLYVQILQGSVTSFKWAKGCHRFEAVWKFYQKDTNRLYVK